MAEEFSYSNDIAPIKGDFFNTRPLSNRESDFIRKRFGAQNDKLAEDVIQLQTARTRMRSADLAYEAGLLDLEEKKEQARRRREEIAQMGTLSQELMSIVDDPEKTTFQKSQELARKQMEINAQGGLTTTASRSLFDGAFKSVSAQSGQGRPSSFTSNAAQQGMVDYVTDEALADGNISPQEQSAIDYAVRVRAKNAEAAQKALKEEQGEDMARNQANQSRFLDKIATDIKGISPSEIPESVSSDDDLIDAIREGSKDIPKVFSANQVGQLKAYAKIVFKDDPAGLKLVNSATSGELIQGAILNKIRRQQAKFSSSTDSAPVKSAGLGFFE